MLAGRILLVAFEGWNDATEGASGTLKAIAEQLDVQTLDAVDPEDYFDFQFSRPMVEFDAQGNRIISWPGCELLQASPAKISQNPGWENLYLLLGTEPSRRWLSFAGEILEMVQDREIDYVIMLGAMLADVPHTRPMQIFRATLTDLRFDTSNLASLAFDWERSIDEMAQGDDEMSAYVTQLEKNRDDIDSEEVSGDQLAREFERYLRQRPESPDKA